MKILKLLLIVIIILSVAVWGWVKYTTETQQQKEVIHIAFVGPLTGPGGAEGKSLLQGIQFYLDALNSKGGVRGKKVILDEYDDQGEVEKATKVANEIAKSSAIAVIGHHYTTTSKAGGEIYKEHHIPAITPSATGVNVTKGNPWYFRTVFDDHSQGRFLANYLKKVLNQNSVTVIHHDQEYGDYLSKIFIEACNELGIEVKFERGFQTTKDTAQFNREVTNIVTELESRNETGFILLAMYEHEGAEIIRLIKDKSIQRPIILPAAFITRNFISRFDSYPKEKQNPGYYTDDIYVSAPLIFDTANEQAQRFKDDYKKKYQEDADLRAASAYDAALLIVEAIKSNQLTGQPATLKADREKIKEHLASIRTSSDAIEGLTGLNYFNEYGDAQKPVSIGTFKNRNIISALVQLQDVRNLNEIADLKLAERDERIVFIDGKPMYKTNVVYVGIKANKISNINEKELTYFADFNLWFRYRGNIRTDSIQFLNAVGILPETEQIKTLEEGKTSTESSEQKGNTSSETALGSAMSYSPAAQMATGSLQSVLATPLRPLVTSGYSMQEINSIDYQEDSSSDLKERMAYRLYQVKGHFKLENLFSEHVLSIRFHHRDLTRNNLIYVIDILGMGLSDTESLGEKLQKAKILTPPSKWSITRAISSQEIFRENSLGNPHYLSAKGGKVDYSLFNIAIYIKNTDLTIRRTVSNSTANMLLLVSSSIFLLVVLTASSLKNLVKFVWFFYAVLAFLILWSSEIVLIQWIVDEKDAMLGRVVQAFDILWWVVPAVLLHLAVELLLWRPLEDRSGRKVPRIGRRFVSFTIYTITFFAVIAFVYDQRLTSLLATGGVIAMIIGLAIQINISNIFSGIAINVEQPFRVGDWVTIGKFDEGRVVDITWRTTRIHTRAGCILSIPNSVASESPIHNFDYPDDSFWISFIVHIHPAHSPERVQKIVRDAVLSTEVVLKEPDPYVIFRGISTWSADYLVYCAVRDYTWRLLHEEAIWTRIWVHLNRAGIAPAIQRQEVHLFKGIKERGEEIATKPRIVLEEVDIFRPFSDSAKNYLSERMQMRRASEGEVIVRQGEMGDSLFILVEGVVGVRVQAQSGEPIEVARLGAGNFFGEMALLTGEERTATVVAVTNTILFEITKDNIAGLMSQQPEVSELISKILTERQIMTQSQIHAQRDTPIEEEAIYKRFREKIENFFGLRN